MARKYGVRILLLSVGSIERREYEFPLINGASEQNLQDFKAHVKEFWAGIYRYQQDAIDKARAQVDARYDPEAGRG